MLLDDGPFLLSQRVCWLSDHPLLWRTKLANKQMWEVGQRLRCQPAR